MPLSPKIGGRNGTAKSKVVSSSGSKAAKKAHTPKKTLRKKDPIVYLQNIKRATELIRSKENTFTQIQVANQCKISVDILRK